MVDKTVTIEGVAGNGKAGAIVMVGTNGAPVYVDGMEAWPKGMDGKKVTATGVVKTEKKIPDPVGPEGQLMQGAWGEQQVIHDARLAEVRKEWKSGIGSTALVRGTARNAKAGAIVETPIGPCYLEGLASWPKDVEGKPVSAAGRLLRNKWPRTPKNDDSSFGGEAGEQWQLDDPRWSTP